MQCILNVGLLQNWCKTWGFFFFCLGFRVEELSLNLNPKPTTSRLNLTSHWAPQVVPEGAIPVSHDRWGLKNLSVWGSFDLGACDTQIFWWEINCERWILKWSRKNAGKICSPSTNGNPGREMPWLYCCSLGSITIALVRCRCLKSMCFKALHIENCLPSSKPTTPK